MYRMSNRIIRKTVSLENKIIRKVPIDKTTVSIGDSAELKKVKPIIKLSKPIESEKLTEIKKIKPKLKLKKIQQELENPTGSEESNGSEESTGFEESTGSEETDKLGESIESSETVKSEGIVKRAETNKLDDSPKKQKLAMKKVTPKIVLKVTKKISEESDEIDISDFSDTTKKTTTEMSKEDLIENLESQRDNLIKNRSKYLEKDYQFKLSTIESLLSKTKTGWTMNNLSKMEDTRIKIDKIVLDKKIPEKQFKSTIDLTGERDDKDRSMGIVIEGRSFFDKKKSYLKIPKELEKLDPKCKNFGNKPIPKDLLKMINFV